MTYVHHYGIMQSIFTTLDPLCFTYISLSSLLTLVTPDLCLFQSVI